MSQLPVPDCGIYQIEHVASGKKYIGSARRIRRRISKHKTDLRAGKHHCSKLQRSWDKYGEDAFAFSVVEPIADEAQLLAREQHWIDTEQTLTAGFNICPVAGSCRGRVVTPEHRAKLSAAQSGKKRPPEHFAKAFGVPRSEEVRAKISAAKKGKPISAEALAERKTRTSSAETRAKQSASLKGKAHSAESRRRAWVTRRANQEASKL